MFTQKHIDNFKENHLHENENIVFLEIAFLREKGSNKFNDKDFFDWLLHSRGIVIITTSRIIFYRKGWISSEILEELSLNNITAIERKSSLNQRVIKIHGIRTSLEFEVYGRSIEKELISHLPIA